MTFLIKFVLIFKNLIIVKHTLVKYRLIVFYEENHTFLNVTNFEYHTKYMVPLAQLEKCRLCRQTQWGVKPQKRM